MGVTRGSSYYTIVEGPSWTQAEANALALGGHLITINDKSEFDWASQNIWSEVFFKDNNLPNGKLPPHYYNTWFYTGFNDQEKEGNYEWSSGEKTSWNQLSDLIHPQNWNYQQQHFSGWDYGIVSIGSKWDETASRGDIVMMDNAASFYRNNGSKIVGFTEIPLSYFSISDATFREGKGGDVTITRTGGTTTSQTLKIVSSDGSATLSDDDYAQVNKTVTFAAGETSKTINISTTADLNVESDESFSLTMTAEGSDEVPPQISDGSATVTITADDFKRGNSLYTIVDGPNWTQAETEAKRLGGNLITINNNAENTYVVNTIGSGHWIGFTDEGSEGNWKWSSGTNSLYTNWAASRAQPSNSSHPDDGRTQNHAWIHPHFSGEWDDYWNDIQGGLGLLPTSGIAEIPLGGTPTYSISPSDSSIDEKSQSSVRFNITTTDVDNNTRLYYTASGLNINSSDFSSGDIKSSRLIGSDGKATFVLSAAADKTTEGTESFNVKLYSDSQRTNLVATSSSSVSIADTSKTPVKTPTYSLSLSPSAIDEGDAFRASIATTNVNAGTRLYYSIKGGVNSSDFSSSLTGSVAINANGNAFFTRKALADKLTEGLETARIFLYSDQQRTLQVGNTASLSIRDTSTTAKKSTHNISFNRSSIKEGDILTSSVSTSNVDPGTRLYWAFSGNGIQNSDFSSGSLKGSSAIDKSGEFTLTHALKEDLTTEGTEQLTFKLFSDSGRKKLLSQKKLNISDTSTTQQSASLRSASVNASTLNLSFDASLDNTKPNHKRFSITADGKSIDISSSSLNAGAGTLKLNLASAIKPDQTVKLTYNDLNRNQSNGVLQNPKTPKPQNPEIKFDGSRL